MEDILNTLSSSNSETGLDLNPIRNQNISKKITRREFAGKSANMAAVISLHPLMTMENRSRTNSVVRLGGHLFAKYNGPDEWVKALVNLGYKAAYCPGGTSAGQNEIRAYKEAAAKADIVISEVGTWSNPISPDEQARNEALEKCINGLRLADEIGAAC